MITPALMYQREECVSGLEGSRLESWQTGMLVSTPSRLRAAEMPTSLGIQRRLLPFFSPVGERQSPTVEKPLDFVDAAWIARVQDGCENAARALMDRLYPTVLKTVRCHLPRRTSEEDLVQVIFSRVFNHLDQFSGNVPIEHWVSRIAVNTCINQLKHETVRRELRMSDLTEEEEAVVQRLASTNAELPDDQSAAARELLEQLMARLKPDERLVITLLYLEEKTVKEISRITGWSMSLVKVKAFRCRHKMRKLWKTLLQGRRY